MVVDHGCDEVVDLARPRTAHTGSDHHRSQQPDDGRRPNHTGFARSPRCQDRRRTLAGLKVTPHGLRHQGAAEQYEAITGEKPPIAGGAPVDPEADRRARREVARDLGHRRVAISNVYLGQPTAAAAKPGAAKTPVDQRGSPPTD
jgi:integrase